MISLGFASFIRQVGISALIVVGNNFLKFYRGDIAIAVLSSVMFAAIPLFGAVIAGSQFRNRHLSWLTAFSKACKIFVRKIK